MLVHLPGPVVLARSGDDLSRATAAARPGEEPTAPWMPPDWARLEETGILGMRLKGSSDPSAQDIAKVLASVVARAREEIPLAASPKRFPVLVFSSGSQTIPNIITNVSVDGNTIAWTQELMGMTCKASAVLDGVELKGTTDCGHASMTYAMRKK